MGACPRHDLPCAVRDPARPRIDRLQKIPSALGVPCVPPPPSGWFSGGAPGPREYGAVRREALTFLGDVAGGGEDGGGGGWLRPGRPSEGGNEVAAGGHATQTKDRGMNIAGR